jgi:hypothetical protein
MLSSGKKEKENPNLDILYNRFPICSQFYRRTLIFNFYVWFIAKIWLNCNPPVGWWSFRVVNWAFQILEVPFSGYFLGKKWGVLDPPPTLPDFFRAPPLGLREPQIAKGLENLDPSPYFFKLAFK